MPAYITVDFTPIDKDQLQEYGAAVPATLVKFAWEYLVKGPAEQLLGDTEFQLRAILEFPSKDLAFPRDIHHCVRGPSPSTSRDQHSWSM